jgi:hypothetical protein
VATGTPSIFIEVRDRMSLDTSPIAAAYMILVATVSAVVVACTRSIGREVITVGPFTRGNDFLPARLLV